MKKIKEIIIVLLVSILVAMIYNVFKIGTNVDAVDCNTGYEYLFGEVNKLKKDMDDYKNSTNDIKAMVITMYNQGGAHGVNTDGSTWDESGDSFGYMKAITQSDIISAPRASYGSASYSCTVLKKGYYLIAGAWTPSYYNEGDTFSVTGGASAGGNGYIIYYGETNPFAE